MLLEALNSISTESAGKGGLSAVIARCQKQISRIANKRRDIGELSVGWQSSVVSCQLAVEGVVRR